MITLNTSVSAGGASSVLHGLDQKKIVGMQASLVDGSLTIFPNHSFFTYDAYIDGPYVFITNVASSITNKTVTILLTYIE
jgi:hypothetical protein